MTDQPNVYPFGRDLSEMQRNLDRLKGGDGGGTSGEMETRVARLESDMEHVKRSLTSLDTRVGSLQKDLGDTKVDVATLKENVRHLPTKPWMFTTLAAMLTVLAAVVGAIVRFIPHAG